MPIDSGKISENLTSAASQALKQTVNTVQAQAFEEIGKDVKNQVFATQQSQNQNPTQNSQNPQQDLNQQAQQQAIEDEKDIANVRAKIDKEMEMGHHETAEKLSSPPKQSKQETPTLLQDFPKEELPPLNPQNLLAALTPEKTNLPQKPLSVIQAQTKIETGRGTKG